MAAARAISSIPAATSDYEVIADELSLPGMSTLAESTGERIQIEIKTSVLLDLLVNRSLCAEDMYGISVQDKKALRNLYLECLRR